VSLDYFFNQWFYGQGYPSFTVKWQQNLNNYAHVTISQVTSDASVNFFKVPLALTFKNGTQSKTFVVNDTINNLDSWLDIGFAADTVLIDPDQQLISKNNESVKLMAASIVGNDVALYPNPFSNQLNVSIKNPLVAKWQFQLYNAAGKKLFINSYQISGADATIQLRPTLYLQPGIYLLVIDGGNTHLVKKIVKG
jgi:hypothetical protein